MRLLRALGLGAGLLTALGVLVTRGALTRYAEQVVAAAPAADPPVAEPSPSRTVRRVRLALGGLGFLVLLTGIWKVLHAVQPASYVWLAVWLLGAVVLHDGVLAPLLNVLRLGAHRGLGRLPEGALALLKAGFVVGGLLVLVVVPEIWAQHLGPANPTVLPGHYASSLLAVLGAIALATAVGVGVVSLRARRTGLSQTSAATGSRAGT